MLIAGPYEALLETEEARDQISGTKSAELDDHPKLQTFLKIIETRLDRQESLIQLNT